MKALNKSEIEFQQLLYYFTLCYIKLSLLTGMNYDHMFKLKLATIKSIPDIY
jgi:hypothetical protein